MLTIVVPPATVEPLALRAELARLADEVNLAGLRPEHRYAALGHLANAAVELDRPKPDLEAVGLRVARTARVLQIAGAGSALVDSLAHISAVL